VTTKNATDTLDVSWTIPRGSTAKKWRVYAATSADLKGALVGEVDGNATSLKKTSIRYAEGEWWVRVVGVSSAGVERPWRSAAFDKIRISRRSARIQQPSDLSSGGAAVCVPAPVVRVTAAKPKKTDPPAEIEVIRGPSVDRGHVVARVPLPQEEEDDPAAGAPIGVPIEPPRANETLLVRAVSPGAHVGQDGAATSVSVVAPSRPLPGHEETILASIEGTTRVGFDAPAGDDPWELDATYGVMIKELPAGSAMTGATWGQGNSGPFADFYRFGGKFLNKPITITSTERDLGAVKDFALFCYDEAQIETAISPMWTRPATTLRHFPAWPADRLFLRDDELGPAAMMRFVTGEGKLREPIREDWHRWEYRVSSSSPVSGSWLPYVPGARLNGRYVQVRLTLEMPFGSHHLVVPKLAARAYIDHADDDGTPHDGVLLPVGHETDTGAHAGVLVPIGFGGLSLLDGSTAQALAASTPAKMTGFDTALAADGNVTVSAANDEITIGSGAAGTYRVEFAASFYVDADETIEVRLRKSALEQSLGATISADGTIRQIGFSGIIALATSDVLSVYVEASGAVDFTPVDAQFVVQRVK
jgi:hypothetical protein